MTDDSLLQKRILVGITGGIAAYKAAEIVRQFVKKGADVRVVMTPAAAEFITPLTLQALSGNPVSLHLLDESAEMGMGHIELARWAELLIVAPATADFIARINAGMANDLLSSLFLATQAKIAIAPAMNEKMWLNPITQHNLRQLNENLPNLAILGPAAGEQACGDIGYGRMLEPEQIVQLSQELIGEQSLKGKHIVITAGPTQESIDPVRYISNHSSGKMGFALAKQAMAKGAQVTLIAGPVSLQAPEGLTRIDIISAEDLLAATLGVINTSHCDIFIGTAAVADFRPVKSSNQKLKKDGDDRLDVLHLTENPDILATVANHKKRPTIVVGFAAETQNIEAHARQKIRKKGVDAIIANDVSRSDIGFSADQNEVIWISQSSFTPFGPASKADVANFILTQLIELTDQTKQVV